LNETLSISIGDILLKEELFKKQYIVDKLGTKQLLENWPEKSFIFGRSRNIEYLKIGSAIELLLKSRLLENNCIIHKVKVNKSLESEIQKEEPLFIKSITTDDSIFDLIDDQLTIDLRIMTQKTKYKAIYGLPSIILDHIDAIRIRRNIIHLPLVRPKTPTADYFSTMTKLVNYARKLKEIISDDYDRIKSENNFDFLPKIDQL
jgi:hypothetical protein